MKQQRQVKVSIDTTSVQKILDDLTKAAHTLKFWDTQSGYVSIVNTPVYSQICIPPQGVATGNRVADTIRLSHMEFRCNMDQANIDLYSSVRITIFVWNADTAADIPTGTDIYQRLTDVPLSPFCYETRQKFRVIKDFTTALVGSASALTNVTRVFTTWNIGLGNAKCIFNPGLITGNHLLYVAITSDSAVAPFPLVGFYSRVYYYDD